MSQERKVFTDCVSCQGLQWEQIRRDKINASHEAATYNKGRNKAIVMSFPLRPVITRKAQGVAQIAPFMPPVPYCNAHD